jgi:hypothetical protein
MRIEVDHHRCTNRETLAQAFSLEKQLAGGAIGKVLWDFTRREIVHPEAEGLENFATFRKHLENGGTGILYLKDPTEKITVPLAASAAEANLVPLDRLGLFVSRRQVDWHQGKHVPNYIQHLLLESFWGNYPGVTMIRLVQPKDRDIYTDWAKYNPEAYARAEAFAKTPGNIMVVTPEGERNPNGLGKAQIGFAALFRETKDTALAMPIAIPEGTSRVIAGPPISWKQAVEDHKSNPGMDMKTRLMARLALLFPPEQRGAYAQTALEFVMPPIAA